ncbi:hypothetical protein B0J15DRAFT_46318 [Fusarium solani]|uniref:Uncharacterized protein n=1 Tax=Fusarium solani TaxID=169388 RepID=A0A9P9H3R5_FUSSL|nr:uncharacterized protein B0J15DRAFT_46318 [Fusarium solani]KAH7250593.1 hypothetical protein B0J15DRAFT_46318 [Fusarium solani]
MTEHRPGLFVHSISETSPPRLPQRRTRCREKLGRVKSGGAAPGIYYHDSLSCLLWSCAVVVSSRDSLPGRNRRLPPIMPLGLPTRQTERGLPFPSLPSAGQAWKQALCWTHGWIDRDPGSLLATYSRMPNSARNTLAAMADLNSPAQPTRPGSGHPSPQFTIAGPDNISESALRRGEPRITDQRH